MKPRLPFLFRLMLAATLTLPLYAEPLEVVTSLPDYADLARQIAGSRARVFSLVQGNQDPHFIRPKPSFVRRVARADLLIATGLDLELWLPTLVNRSGNNHVRSGQPGYVAVATGIEMKQVPQVLSRSEGGMHIYGNPHITPSPLNMKVVARNITNGLIRNDAEGRSEYESRLATLLDTIDRRVFGDALVDLFGGEELDRLAQHGELLTFLEENELDGRPLLDRLGGWLGKMLPFRDRPVVTYHQNWIYLVRLFSLVQAGTVEPRPGIPPTARHRSELLAKMRGQGVRVVLAANYFNQDLARRIAQQAGGHAVLVPLLVGGAPGTETYFDLVDHWVAALTEAFGKDQP